MISYLLRKVRREVCYQVISELFRYNERDDCWDPIGSLDSKGLSSTLELIARNKLNSTLGNYRVSLIKRKLRS